MRANRFVVLAIASLFGLLACGGNEKKEGPVAELPKEPVVPPADAKEIEYCIEKLSNPSLSERWRERLFELSQITRSHTKVVVERLDQSYKESLGGNSRTLNDAGRARAVWVLGRIETGKEGKPEVKSKAAELVASAKSDSSLAVRVAVWEVFAGRGDASLLKEMLASSGKIDGDLATPFSRALEALASPERSAEFVAALRYENLEVMSPLVLKCFKGANVANELRGIASRTKNPAAFIFVAKTYAAQRESAGVAVLAEHFDRFKSEVPVRKVVFSVIGELSRESSASERGVEFLFNQLKVGVDERIQVTDALESIDPSAFPSRLLSLSKDADVAAATRGYAILRLARLPSGSADSEKAALLSIARTLVLKASEARSPAIEAIGFIGDPVSDAELLSRIAVPDESRREIGRDVVKALGAMKSERATKNIVLLMRRFADLREPATLELLKKEKSELPLSELVELLNYSDVEVRKSSHQILQKAVTRSIRYNPEGPDDEREAAIQSWRNAIADR